jgi:hypothetical protein
LSALKKKKEATDLARLNFALLEHPSIIILRMRTRSPPNKLDEQEQTGLDWTGGGGGAGEIAQGVLRDNILVFIVSGKSGEPDINSIRL